MSKEAGTNTGKQGGAPALSNNFKGKKPADAKAPLIDGGGKFTPSTSQSNIRGPQGQ